MREMILGDISVPLNHITEGIEEQAHTWSLAAPLVLVFLLFLFSPSDSTSLASLVLFFPLLLFPPSSL